MDSRSRRLPFCLSNSRPSYTSSPSVSSTSLGTNRLYSRETVLHNDRFPRASSPYKTDIERQNSRLLSSPRDYSSSETRSASWKLPSLTPSGRSYDRPWAESSLSSRSKLTDSEGRSGICSGLLNNIDDADSKRAKLSYRERGLYSRTPSSSGTGSTYSSSGLGSSRGASEKRSDILDSSWSSTRLLSRPSASLSRREHETKNEPGLSSLGERQSRTPGLVSALCQTDRVMSTYAQGARPKESTYTPASFSSATRESSLNRHLASQWTPPTCSAATRTSSRFTNVSASLHSSQETTGRRETSDCSLSFSSQPLWHSPPAVRPERAPQRPAPEVGEPDGRSSTRRLLSRLFSRRSSQDSSSGSSSLLSLDDDAPSNSGESTDGDEGARVSGSGGADVGGSEKTSAGLRNQRAELSPIQERPSSGGRDAGSQPRMASWNEPAASSDDDGAGRSSWLSSSLRGRCPPLLSRLRRHVREGGAHAARRSEEGCGHPRHARRRCQEEEEDDDEEEDEEAEEEDEEQGAVGAESLAAGNARRQDDADALPDLEDVCVPLSPRRRVGVFRNLSLPLGASGGAESQAEGQEEKVISSSDQEKLRKIKERLLLEDSDEDEGDLCRICQMGEDSSSNPLIQPCRCTGSLQYVHQECIKRWLRSKIGSGTNLEAISTCELCKEKLRLNIDNFDIQELYRTHVQSEYDDFISSGLYLVVLLHFCEQRFSDVLGAVDAAGLFNLVRILHEHMDSLEISHEESDDEVRDSRPSIDFSDLDYDFEEEY